MWQLIESVRLKEISATKAFRESPFKIDLVNNSCGQKYHETLTLRAGQCFALYFFAKPALMCAA